MLSPVFLLPPSDTISGSSVTSKAKALDPECHPRMTKHFCPQTSLSLLSHENAYLLSDSSSWFSQVPRYHMQVGPETSSSVTCTHDPDYPQMPDIRAGGANHGIAVSHPSQSLLCKARCDNQRAKWTQLPPLPFKATWLSCQPVTSLDNE